MLRDYEGHVTAVDFGDYAEANPARTPSTSYYYYDATMHIYPDDAECFARSYHEGGDCVVVVRGADGGLLASVICSNAYSAQYVLVALSTLDGPTLALTLGLLWSLRPDIWTADHTQPLVSMGVTS